MRRIVYLSVSQDEYRLDLTLYPSFILTMMLREDEYWIKKYGYAKGTRLRQTHDKIEVELPENVPDSTILELTGLWYDPYRFVHDVDRQYRDIVEKLIEYTHFVRLAISRRDPIHIFVSTFLSRNTDYYINVIRWVHAICEITDDRLDALGEDIVKRVSNSYQLRQLPEAIKYFLASVLKLYLESASYWEIRKALLSIRNVGPKVADAFLIFTGCTTELAPSDIHFRRFVQRLNLFDSFALPDKKFCVKYTCDSCPNNRCLTGTVYKKFGRLSSWIQTVSYVVDRLYCSRNKCRECPLYKKICNV